MDVNNKATFIEWSTTNNYGWINGKLHNNILWQYGIKKTTTMHVGSSIFEYYLHSYDEPNK